MLMFSKQDIEKYEVKITNTLWGLAKTILSYVVFFVIAGILLTLVFGPMIMAIFEGK